MNITDSNFAVGSGSKKMKRETVSLYTQVILAILVASALASTQAQAVPPGYVLCKHYDGTVAMFKGNSCPSGGWMRQY